MSFIGRVTGNKPCLNTKNKQKDFNNLRMASIDSHQDQCPTLHHILAADLESWAVPEIFISELKQLPIFLVLLRSP